MLKRISTLLVGISTLIVLFAHIGFMYNSFAANSSNEGFSLFTDNGKEDEFLHPDKAFKLEVAVKDGKSIEGAFIIAPGYYLYKDRIKLILKTIIRAQLKR